MPLCVHCGKALVCGCEKAKVPVEGGVLPCRLKKGAIWIHVTDDDATDLSQISVAVAGQAAVPTKPSGLGVFDPLDPGKYTARLEPLTPAQAKAYDAPEAMSEEVSVGNGEITYVGFVLTRRAKLKVVVKEDGGPKLFEKASVTIDREGVTEAVPTGADGVADFAFRSPGDYAITVALDAPDAKKYKCKLESSAELKPGDDLTVTILVPKPRYILEFRLGEIDAIFSPIAAGPKPWADAGVRERLQALGYLYTPLRHPQIGLAGPGPSRVEGHAQACWEYYKEVHKVASDAEGVAKLKDETKGNLLAAAFPSSGQVLPESVLPAPGTFSIIRLPGGYGTTKSPVTNLNAGDHYYHNSTATVVPGKYEFKIGYRRNEMEDRVWEDNPALGKIPLIAEVKAEWPDGSRTPAEDVPVLFRLVAPDDHSGTPFGAPVLPDKVMNYDRVGVWWQTSVFPPQVGANGGLDESEWKGIWALVHKAWDETGDDALAKAKAEGWLPNWMGFDEEVPWTAVADWWEDKTVTPYQRLIQNPELVVSKIPNILKKIPDLAAVPGKPSKMAVGLTALTDAEWTAMWRLVTVAAGEAARAGSASQQTEQFTSLCSSWVRTWGAAPFVSWGKVSDWWTGIGDTPYPRVRESTKIDRLKSRIDFLLQERVNGLARVAEISGIGQKKYIDDRYTEWEGKAGADNPQKKNVWHERGGKSGHPDGIKAVLDQPGAAIDGFHNKRPTQQRDFGTLRLATAPADPGKNPHASECKTNDKGFAGVLFLPSRCGGDSYKLSAYIDPDWLKRESDGPKHEPSATSGSMIVWRNLRLYRYIQMANPQANGTRPSAWLAEILNKGKYPPGHSEYGLMRLDSPMIDLAILPGGATEARPYAPVSPGELLAINERSDHFKYRPLTVSPTPFSKQFGWGYCEWIADCAGKEALTNQERLDATLFARASLERWWVAQGFQPVHWDTLFGFSTGNPRVDDTSPFLLNLRVFTHYNEIIEADPSLSSRYAPFETAADVDKSKMTKALQYFFEAMMEYFGGGGVVPGFTIVQIPRGDNTEARAGYMTGASTITSGYGTGSRGLYISHTEAVYHGIFRIYPNTSNTLHELGHVLGLAHQPPAGADLVAAHQAPMTDPWQTPAGDQCVCVMSYSGCYGDLCGECLLSLRGCKQPQTDDQIGALYTT